MVFLSIPIFAGTPAESERADSKSFPILQPVTIALRNLGAEQSYKDRLVAWEALPKVFHKHQVAELVAVNTKYKTFEAKFVNFGKIGTKVCNDRVSGIVKDKGLVAGRCGASDVPYSRKTNPPGDYDIKDVNNTQAFHELADIPACEADHQNSNYNYVGKPSFDFKKPYCTISLQYRSHAFRKVENEPTRNKRKPSMWRKEDRVINAKTNKSTIGCGNEYFLLVDTRYNHNFSAKRCFNVPAGAELSFGKSLTDKDGNNLIKARLFASNVKYGDKSLYFNAADITVSDSDSAF